MGKWKDLMTVLTGVSLDVLLSVAAKHAMNAATLHVNKKEWWKAARATHVLDHIEAARMIQSGDVTPETLHETAGKLQELYDLMIGEKKDEQESLAKSVEA